MKRLALLMIILIVLCGCFSAKPLTTNPLIYYNKHTEYRIDKAREGFMVTVYYSRYQFFMERYDIIAEVEAVVRDVALVYAGEKQIKPIDTNRAIMSWGRKPMPGITTCHYQVLVEYWN